MPGLCPQAGVAIEDSHDHCRDLFLEEPDYSWEISD